MMRWQADQTSSALVSLSSCLSARVCRVVRRHPEQKKYMLSKEKVYASSSSEGKGIRMIIDFLRDPMSCPVSEARAIIDEKPAFTSGLEKFEMDVHDQQLDWLSEELGIKLADSEEPAERYAVRGPLLVRVAAFPAPRLRAAVSHTLDAAVPARSRCSPGSGSGCVSRTAVSHTGRSRSGKWRERAWIGRCGWRRRGTARTTSSTRPSAASTAESPCKVYVRIPYEYPLVRSGNRPP